jgi:hypothetical protein
VVGPLGAQANARSGSEPEAALLWLFGGNLQPFAAPDPVDPLVVDHPTRLAAQQLGVADAVRAIGVTEVTYYRWRQEYGVSMRSAWRSDCGHVFGLYANCQTGAIQT